jgi:uncharacterized delta-60 repeat protein
MHFLLTGFFLALTRLTLSQAISIDSGFNGNGRRIVNQHDSITFTNFEFFNSEALAVQVDGKVIVAGLKSDSLILRRYKVNGSPDSSFGRDGAAVNYRDVSQVTSILVRLLPGGKMLVLFWKYNLNAYTLCRYFADGKPDTNFGIQGEIQLNLPLVPQGFLTMEIQKDGKILLAGSSKQNTLQTAGFYLARLTASGDIDRSFGISGAVNNVFSFHVSDTLNGSFFASGAAISEMAIQEDGKILACGTTSTSWNGDLLTDSIALVRYTTNGTFDSSFNGTGKLLFDVPPAEVADSHGTRGNSISLQPDGKIVVGGAVYSSQIHGEWQQAVYVLLRVLPDGRMDSSFSQDGLSRLAAGSFNECIKTFIQSDGRILFAGNSAAVGPFFPNQPGIALGRVHGDGSFDTEFGAFAMWTPPFYDINNTLTPFRAYKVAMNAQRIYVLAEMPYNFDYPNNGKAILVFKTDAVLLNSRTVDLCAAGSNTSLGTDLPGQNYQWQLSIDSFHFNNIVNDEHYSGTTTSTVSLNNIPVTWSGYQYRCISSNGTGNTTSLHFLGPNENEWTGKVSNVWEDPGNWLCGTLPGPNSTVIIANGNVVIHSNVSIRNIRLQPGTGLTVDSGYNFGVASDPN